jgi:hypothetical protein
LEGRAELLRKLGGVGLPRPGALFDVVATGGDVRASSILAAVLDKLSPIWPSPMGDVWQPPASGWVPFHKLSQWMAYSLLEPFEWCGVKVHDVDLLTALPEYRNGGLLLDTGLLRLRDEKAAGETWQLGDEIIVEWRALTVALMDEVAAAVRLKMHTDEHHLPLCKVLEGGSWAAGRALAQRLRDGLPPLKVVADPTVF